MWDSTRDLFRGVLSHDRVSLSRAITLIESSRDDHREQASLLLDALLHARAKRAHAAARQLPSLRIGFAGPPGAGKSSLIEAIGLQYLSAGARVAVLAIDPSSTRSGGSILGDKTRMPRLSADSRAYVRPSPTRGALGGVARSTNEVILLAEGGGYDVVLVESVGVGQSETLIDEAVDCVVLVVSPAGGDELQGVKRGIVEVADIIVVNKADGDLLPSARHAAAEYRRATQLMRAKHAGVGVNPATGEPAWSTHVMTASALKGSNIADVVSALHAYRTAMERCGALAARREAQASTWMWDAFQDSLVRWARSDAGVIETAARLRPQLVNGFVTPRAAAQQLFATISSTARSRSTHA